MFFSPFALPLSFSFLLAISVPSSLSFLLIPQNGRQRSSSFSARSFRRFVHGQNDVIANRNPIVLIPGDGGSRLRANLTGKPSVVHYFCERQTTDFFALWLDLQQFGPFVIDCWADNMRLDFNRTSGKAKDLEGVKVKVPGFGHTRTVECDFMIDSSKRSPGRYFATIVTALTKWGYQRGIDVVGAPYDWRRAPNELYPYFVKLRLLIEQLYHSNGNRKVIVLAHSMGNPMANFFYNKIVDKAWKDTFLLSHISLAGAWGGSAQIVKLFASGYNMDYFRVLLPPSRLRSMQRSFTSSAFLFPSAALWKSDEILAITPRQNYTLSNLNKFFADVQYPQGFDQWKSASQTLVLDSPGVKVHCIFGVGVDTPDQFQWTHNWFFPDYQPYIRYGDGDGTVNRRSLEVCERWAEATDAGGATEVHRVNGTDHMGILSDERTLALIRDILTENERRKEDNETNGGEEKSEEMMEEE